MTIEALLLRIMSEAPPPTEDEIAGETAAIKEVTEESERLRNLPKRTLSDFSGDVAPAFRVVLSGLSERGNCSGMYKLSVVHAMALRPLDSGRLKRSTRQFLCSTKDRGFGKNGAIGQAISCSVCRDRVQRHRLTVCSDRELSDLLRLY
jgi:hypothetical protein